MSDKNHAFPLNQIYFYLTEGCNLACRHCWINPKYQGGGEKYPALDLNVFLSIIEQAKAIGLKTVKLTGGEPLLHPQIKQILEIIQANDLLLTMETNGILCTPEMAEKIKDCKHHFVSVSLDGVDAETHEWVRGVPGSFEAALTGIRNLVKAGLRPQIIFTIMQRNKDQLEAVARLAEQLGAGSLKFNFVQPTARGEKMQEAGETLSVEELIKLGNWAETELRAAVKNISIYFSHPPAFQPLGRLFGNGDGGCRVCGIFGILGVLADGSYALCGIGESVPEFIFGNAAQDQLKEVWESTPMLNEIREGLPDRLEGVCGECVMKKQCSGHCLAQNYYRSRSLWSPYWYCEMAREAGLFPESRLRI